MCARVTPRWYVWPDRVDDQRPGYAPLLRTGFPPEARCGERRGRTRGKWLAKASLLFIRSRRNSWKMSHAFTILGSTRE